MKLIPAKYENGVIISLKKKKNQKSLPLSRRKKKQKKLIYQV